MTKPSSLYELFDATSLQNCDRLIQNGEIPTAKQLADIIAANPDQARPRWFDDLVIKALRGELKQKQGRPKERIIEQYRFAAATHDYQRLLKIMTRRKKTVAGSRDIGRSGDRASLAAPLHERAAQTVIERWRLNISWRAFLNRISSQK